MTTSHAEYLTKLPRDYPTAWGLCDEYTALREDYRGSDIPDWNAWAQPDQVVVYAAWRPTRKGYPIVSSFYMALVEATPAEVLTCFFVWCRCITTSGLTRSEMAYFGRECDGFFVVSCQDASNNFGMLCFILCNPLSRHELYSLVLFLSHTALYRVAGAKVASALQQCIVQAVFPFYIPTTTRSSISLVPYRIHGVVA